MHGRPERLVLQQVLQPRPLARVSGEADHRAVLRLERLLEHRGEVAARVTEAVLHLEAQPDGAVVAHERRRGHRQQEQSSTSRSDPLTLTGAVGGGDQLAHRDEVALAGQTRERAMDEHRGRAVGSTVQAL